MVASVIARAVDVLFVVVVVGLCVVGTGLRTGAELVGVNNDEKLGGTGFVGGCSTEGGLLKLMVRRLLSWYCGSTGHFHLPRASLLEPPAEAEDSSSMASASATEEHQATAITKARRSNLGVVDKRSFPILKE